MLFKIGSATLLNTDHVVSVWENEDGVVEISMSDGDVFTAEDESFEDIYRRIA